MKGTCAGEPELLEVDSTFTHQRNSTSLRFRCGGSVQVFTVTAVFRASTRIVQAKIFHEKASAGNEEPILAPHDHEPKIGDALFLMISNTYFRDMLDEFDSTENATLKESLKPRAGVLQWTWHLEGSSWDKFKVVFEEKNGESRLRLFRCNSTRCISLDTHLGTFFICSSKISSKLDI